MPPVKLPLVMETDLGRDPDDLFALLFFIGAGVPLRAICVSPGDHDQVAVVKAVLRHFALEKSVPVLTPAARVVTRSINPFHIAVARALGVDVKASLDDTGRAIGNAAAPDGHEDALPLEPVDAFICGPSLMAHRLNARSITMQGGFVPYSAHRPKNVPTLDKFEGKDSFATFNLGGTKADVRDALLDADVPHRFIGKNVCHTVVYTKDIHARFAPTLLSSSSPSSSSAASAAQLTARFMALYLETHEQKAFHDPLAAFLMLHPEHGVWLPLKPQRVRGGFTAVPAEKNHLSLVDLTGEIWPAYFASFSV